MQIETEIVLRMTTGQAGALQAVLAKMTQDEMRKIGLSERDAADMIELYYQLPIREVKT